MIGTLETYGQVRSTLARRELFPYIEVDDGLRLQRALQES